jgi:UDP-4-amino-4,6-dideoxy-N-acetyl-beta-L-altrosamine N-acetyltransferase
MVKSDEYGYMGVIYLNRVDLTNKNAYLGVYANPDCQHVGSGHHLLKCLKELAFDKLNLHTLKLEVLRDNKKARRLYEKSGFTREGTLREFVRRTDVWNDVIIMGLVNSEER